MKKEIAELSNEEKSEVLMDWEEFVPEGDILAGLRILIHFLNSGDVSELAANQKYIAALFTFVKTCSKFAEVIDPIMHSVLQDCASEVSDSFEVSPGAKIVKCKNADDFFRMCKDCNVNIMDACKAIFSGITVKKATELFKLPSQYLIEHYAFETQQNRVRIKLKNE